MIPRIMHRRETAKGRRAWKELRRGMVSAFVALLLVTLWTRINPPNRDYASIPAINPILLRPIKESEVDMRSLQCAAESLSALTGVRISVDANEPGPGRLAPLPVRFQDTSLAEALSQVTER